LINAISFFSISRSPYDSLNALSNPARETARDTTRGQAPSSCTMAYSPYPLLQPRPLFRPDCFRSLSDVFSMGCALIAEEYDARWAGVILA
jgi:hypothetical protein